MKPRQPIRLLAPEPDGNHHDGDVHHDNRDCHHDIGDDNHDDKKEKKNCLGRTRTHPPYKMPELHSNHDYYGNEKGKQQ